MNRIFLVAALLTAVGPMPASSATNPTGAPVPATQTTDTLRLAALQARAVDEDARTRRAELERRATGLRIENLAVARLPQLQLRGDASYQSEVISLPLESSAFAGALPPKERYELALDMDWQLWDGGVVSARRELERAGLASMLAGLDAEIHQTRAEVTDAFFATLLLQEHVREADVLVEDLERRLEEMRVRVDEGAALPGDAATLGAELLVARQRRDQLLHERRTALRVLSDIVGSSIDGDAVLALPDLTEEMTASPGPDASTDGSSALPPAARVHPQFAAFDAQRTTRELQAAAVDASRRPSISVFGQLAYGSPGFDQFNDSLHEYWRAGVRVQWSPWNWNRREREIEELAVQRRIIDTHEERFADVLLRAIEGPLGTIEHLRAALESDDEIIALREEAAEYAEAQLEERAIPVSVYTRARTDLQTARIARLTHRIELARARAQYLITLGVELP